VNDLSDDMDLQPPKEAALKFLARREHSQKELQQKLHKKGFTKEQIISVLELFSIKGWQSDERFAECYIRSRVSAGFGPIRIAFELTQRGVQQHLIEKYLRQSDNQFWINQIKRVFSKRFKLKQVADEQEQYVKQYRFLQNRGFAHHRIIQFLKGYDNEY
jgi:regulatory protein